MHFHPCGRSAAVTRCWVAARHRVVTAMACLPCASVSSGGRRAADTREEERNMLDVKKNVQAFFLKKYRPTFHENVGANNIQFFLNKCWCDSFKKILVQLFMKNISSTFYLKNIVTFLN
jgi:hypothetical protein